MWKANAPANIALIKYMGKTADNLPTNASLSYTLTNFISEVHLKELAASEDRWQALVKDGFSVRLSQKGEERFLKFFARLKQELPIRGNFLIQSANNFPSDCGLASSASSFAALTKAAYQLALEQGGPKRTPIELSRLSREGSGSSCRSFFAPWALWQGASGEEIDLPYPDLIHFVIVVEDKEKAVSSSEAHLRVTGSHLFDGRSRRAENRLGELVKSLRDRDWKIACEVAWQEFWDMHALFETSSPPFGYMQAGSLETLTLVRLFWEKEGDGPMATMDAGPNVHLLFRADQRELARRFRSHLESTKSPMRVIGDDIKAI